MLTMTATNVKRNFDKVFETIQNDYEPIFVIGNEKSMVMISSEYWRNYEETIYLSRNPITRKKILRGLNTPISECVHESEINF